MADNVILYHGTDTFMIKSLIKKYIQSSSVDEFNITYYDMEEVDVEEAMNDALTIPFLVEKRIVVLKNTYFLSNSKPPRGAPKHNLEAFKRYLDNPVDETVLLIGAPYKIVKSKAITKFVLKHCKEEECNPITAADKSRWINNQLAKRKKRINKDALEELNIRLNTDSEILYNEMQKLVLFCEDIEVITLDIVKQVITRNIEDNVFNLSKSILNNNKKEALSIYHDLMYHNEDPMKIIGILVRQYQNILYIKRMKRLGYSKDQMAEYLNVHSKRFYFMEKEANSMHDNDVILMIEKLVNLDHNIKSFKVDKKVGMELFILET